MARRSLLTGDERRRLFELPVDDREVARHYTLSAEDLKWIDARHGPGNQLGAAVQLALLRHPGFGLRASETVPSPVLRFLADQIHAPVTAFAARRDQTISQAYLDGSAPIVREQLGRAVVRLAVVLNGALR
jgi:TnpA family transposase